MFTRIIRLAGCLSLLLASALPLAAQELSGKDVGLLTMMPKEAFFFVERQGHTAVKPAMQASSLGRLAGDDAVLQFVHATRDKIETLMVRSMLELNGPNLDQRRQAFHQFLRPFWYQPCAMYLVYQKEGDPGVSLVCLPGQYAEDARKGLDSLLSADVKPADQDAPRHSFTYKTGWTVWKGVAWAQQPFKLGGDQAAQVEAIRQARAKVLLALWDGPVLRLTTDLFVADLVGKREPTRQDLSMAAKPSVQTVLNKTRLGQWAFRWHVDVEHLFAQAGQGDLPRELEVLGLRAIRGVGGCEGYEGKFYARKTYVDCPGGCKGLLQAFRPGGSYQQALAMVPPEVTFCLAGELNTQPLLQMVRTLAGGAAPPGQPAQDSEPQAVIKAVERLAGASTGHVALFVTDLQSMVAGMGRDFPLGAVLGIKDPAGARAAVQDLMKLAPEAGEPDENQPPALKEYRKVPLLRMGRNPTLYWAVLEDRVIAAFSDNTLKAALDAALDKMGGLPSEGKAKALAEELGKGEAFFLFDLAAVTKLIWPMLMPMAQNPNMSEDFPLASLPSTNKIVSFLGPEVAVFQADAGGLLLNSRGTVPFATKAFMTYPLMFGLFMRF